MMKSTFQPSGFTPYPFNPYPKRPPNAGGLNLTMNAVQPQTRDGSVNLTNPSLSQRDPFRLPEFRRQPIDGGSALRPVASQVYELLQQKRWDKQPQLKPLLSAIHMQKIYPVFEKALAQEFNAHGQAFTSLPAWMEAHYPNTLTRRLFLRPAKAELLDFARYGENRYSAHAWFYRLMGLRRSLVDFAKMIEHHPVVSLTVMAVVGGLGHRYPFLGGVSGFAIMAWGVIATAIHEIKALRLPASDRQHKAAQWTNSGENICATLITALGIKGIRNGTLNGLEKGKAAMKVAKTAGANGLKTAWEGVKASVGGRIEQHYKTNWFETILFVTGLFDNVLLPFNLMADRLQAKAKHRESKGLKKPINPLMMKLF